MTSTLARPVYIVDGARTPFLKAKGEPGPFSASDLAVLAGRECLSRHDFDPKWIDETIIGCVMPSQDEANIGRLVGLRLGCGENTPGYTVARNCASGMQSIDSAIKDIAMGRHDIVLAGGTEAMSHAPLILRHGMVRWLARWARTPRWYQKIGLLPQLKPAYFAPIISLLHGLSDPLYGINMGQTAEILAYEFHVTREEMDAFALASHQKLMAAQDAGFIDELITIYDYAGHVLQADDGLRRDSSLERLAKLKPFFDKTYGQVTAGNSSQVTDGAAILLLASEDAVKRHKLPILGRVVDVEWAALDPKVMGLGPVMAATPLLQRHQLSLDDIDYWEINEAFAAQVLACLRAWESDVFCKTHLGLSGAFGSLDRTRLNIDGGAIAIGHPVGASGARIVLHLLKILARKQAKQGVATICIGGGQGGAFLVERCAGAA